MIGFALKKLAKTHSIKISDGIAYGSMMGYATTLSEGSGWKRIDIATTFPEQEKLLALREEIAPVNLKKEYRVQNLVFSDKCTTVVFLDNPGTMKKLEAFIAWFYPLLEKYGATKADICLQCGETITDGSWYKINNVGLRFHDACANAVQEELEQEVKAQPQEDTGSYMQGFLGALIGSVLGSLVWALVLYLGYVAALVGLLIGWLSNKGYDLLHGKQGKGKIAILIFALILGVVLGTFIPDVIYLTELINAGEFPGYRLLDIPALIVDTFIWDAEYQSAILSNIGVGLLFAGLGAFALIRNTSRQITGTKIKKLR